MNRREFFQLVSAGLAAGHVGAPPDMLEAATSAAEMPAVPAIYVLRKTAASELGSTAAAIAVRRPLPGRFTYTAKQLVGFSEADFLAHERKIDHPLGDMPLKPRASVTFGDILRVVDQDRYGDKDLAIPLATLLQAKAEYMGRLRAHFDMLSVYPAEELSALAEREHFALQKLFGDLPGKAADGSMQQSGTKLDEERDQLFALADARLSPEDAAEVRSQYEAALASRRTALISSYETSTRKKRDAFVTVLHGAIEKGFLDLELQPEGDVIHMDLRFNDAYPLEALPFGRIDEEPDLLSRASTVAEIQKLVDEMTKLDILPSKALQFTSTSGTPPEPKDITIFDSARKTAPEGAYRVHTARLSASQPMMQQIVRGLTGRMATQRLQKKAVDLLSQFPHLSVRSATAVPGDEQAVVYELEGAPSRDNLRAFSEALNQLNRESQAVGAVFDSNDALPVAVDVRANKIKVSVNAKTPPELSVLLTERAAQRSK